MISHIYEAFHDGMPHGFCTVCGANLYSAHDTSLCTRDLRRVLAMGTLL